ncbi:MAG: hypothetical protein ACR2HJ_02010 [Fimbriimonadales bacterium]
MQPDNNDPKRFVRSDETPVVDETAVPEPINDTEAEENEDSKSPGPLPIQAEYGFAMGSPEQTVDVGRQLIPGTEGPGGDREEVEQRRRDEEKTDEKEEG